MRYHIRSIYYMHSFVGRHLKSHLVVQCDCYLKGRDMRNILFMTTMITTLPLAASSEENFLKYKLPSIVKNIAQGYEDGAATSVAKEEISAFTLDMANSGLNLVENSLLDNTRFTHLELSLGSDALGLDTGKQSKSELMAVYGLYETSNTFLFNQTSLTNFNKRNTINIGFGARHINDDETVIVGVNAFYDYETKSAHKRTSLGLELLTSMLELRANKYSAVSKTIRYNGIDETALDGQDVKLTANLPYFYASNVYYTHGKWKDGLGYEVKTKEAGITAEIAPNLTVRVAHQKNGTKKAETVASISYSIPLGNSAKSKKKMQDGSWSLNMRPIREHLYKPVQRENRIVKKVVKLGLTVSGA
jgi:hypothetical protein